MDANEQNFYKRMNEIGEYTYNNRKDTVFVFQLIFIYLLIVIGLMYLKSINIITSFFTFPIIILLTVIIIFILINRIVFTNNIRDKKNWNELNFGTVLPSNYVTAGTEKGVRGLVGIEEPEPPCPSGQELRPPQCVPE
jgi:uncharacterized membrane protein